MKTLQQLIKNKNFDYVNSDITEENFPVPANRTKVEYELVHFDRYISSEDAIKELSKDEWRPATLYELLEWEDWNGKDWVVALGSVAEFDSGRHVTCLYESGSERRLHLDWFDYGWCADCRFLRVHNLDTDIPIRPSVDNVNIQRAWFDRLIAIQQKYEDNPTSENLSLLLGYLSSAKFIKNNL